MLTRTVRLPNLLASEQVGTQMSILRPRIPPPVSDTVYCPVYDPAPKRIWLPSFNTPGSAAIIPRRTPPPVAVLPFKQYAVATKLPRLAALAALTIPVVLTNLFVSASLFVVICFVSDVSVLTCESFAILRTFAGRVWARINTTHRLKMTRIMPPLTRFLIIPTPFKWILLSRNTESARSFSPLAGS